MTSPKLRPLLAPFHFDAVIADKGYDSDPLRKLLAAQQVEVVIPSRRNRRKPWEYDRSRYRERNIVERFINKIKLYRRIFTRYDKLARRFMAILQFSFYTDLAQTKPQRALDELLYYVPQIVVQRLGLTILASVQRMCYSDEEMITWQAKANSS